MKSRTHTFITFLIFQFLRCALTTGRVCSGKGEPLNCCVNNYEVNGTCLECPDGWFGFNCSSRCTENSYGRFCVNVCNCSSEYQCHHVNGCILLSTVSDKEMETNNDDETAISTWVWILVILITLLICGSGAAFAIRTAKKRNFCFDVSAPVTGRKTIEAYSIQRLSTLSEPKDMIDDLQYAEIVRDGTKSKYNTDQNSLKPEKYHMDENSHWPKSNGNIYSTHVLLGADYDKLQFHPNTEKVLDNELDLYDVTVQKS